MPASQKQSEGSPSSKQVQFAAVTSVHTISVRLHELDELENDELDELQDELEEKELEQDENELELKLDELDELQELSEDEDDREAKSISALIMPRIPKDPLIHRICTLRSLNSAAVFWRIQVCSVCGQSVPTVVIFSAPTNTAPS